MLGQGDILKDEESLYKMFKFAENKKLDLLLHGYQAFDANIDDNIELIQRNAYPDNCYVYNSKNKNKIIKYRVLYGDVVCGASVLYKTEAIRKYINIIKNKVRYIEDSTIMFMVLDKINCGYLDDNILLYECGDGISTKSELSKKFIDDLQTIQPILEDFMKKNNDSYI